MSCDYVTWPDSTIPRAINPHYTIKVVINSFKSKAFKNKSFIFTDIKINYLNNILNIILIFVKAITKL
jgi:hypothetical protein